MSRIFKRPMFRKGGNVGEGIMTGIVDREQYALGTSNPFENSRNDQFEMARLNTPTTSQNYEGMEIPSLEDLTAEKKDALLEAAGDRGGFDPLTAFLLTYGPAAVTQTGAGGTIGNLVAAGKEPIANLIKDKAEEDKFQRDIRIKSTGAAISQRDKLIESESDKRFKFDLAKAQRESNEKLTTQEIEALRLRAVQKTKDDIALAIKKSDLDTQKGKDILKYKEKLDKASPEEKVEFYGAIYAKDDYNGNVGKGNRRAEYEYIIAPQIEEKFGVKSNGGFIEIDTTNLEKTNKLMKKKIKSGGLNKYFHNINDGVTYLLTEQGLQPIDLSLPAAENVVTTDTTDKVQPEKSFKEKMEDDPNSIFRKDGLFLTEEEKKARKRDGINQNLSGIGDI